MLLSMTACAPSGSVTDAFCNVGHPILISKDDILTPNTEREILLHNTTGQQICGW